MYRGDFSRRVLELCEPSEFVLIDSWKYDLRHHVPFSNLTENYGEFLGKVHWDHFGDDPSATQEANHKHVVEQFGGDNRVTIVRENSFDGIRGLPDRHFDAIYIDANHQYEFVLRDLLEARHKVKPGGLLVMNDFYEGPGGAEQNLGVLGATTTFVKRFDYFYVAMTHGAYADVALTDDPTSELVKAFLNNLMCSNLTFIGINDAVVPNIRYRVFEKSNGETRYVAML